MSRLFEELDYCPTAIGTLTLRRRRDARLGSDVFEIKLGEEFLMSSSFTASEIALAEHALDALEGDDLSVVVGGLGLGYTAHAALRSDSVGSLIVVEGLGPVIEWHEKHLLPLGAELAADARCRLVHGDFFAMARAPRTGFDPDEPGARFDAVMLDIDHSPSQFLHPDNASFYTPEGLGRMAEHLRAGGVFALWSNEPEDPGFTRRLSDVFASARAESVVFDNPLQERKATQTIYLARKA